MSAPTNVGARIAFATSSLSEAVDVRTDGDVRHHHTLHVPPPVGEGRIDLVNLGHGLALMWGYCIPHGETVRCRIEPTVSVTQLIFHRSASVARVVLGGRTRSRLFERHEMILLPPGVTGTVVIEPDVKTEQVAILVTGEGFARLEAEDPGEQTLASLLNHPSGTRRTAREARPVVANSVLDVAVSQLLTCPLHGPMARLYLEAKTIEVIALTVDHLNGDATRARRVSLNRQDIELLDEARRYLLQSFRSPPTIAELAHLIGLNRTKLKAGFHQRYNTTIYAFVREQRMHEAMNLLQSGSCNVTEAAHLVGYASLSAFAVAFKATHGFCPCAVRGVPEIEEPPAWCGCEE